MVTLPIFMVFLDVTSLSFPVIISKLAMVGELYYYVITTSPSLGLKGIFWSKGVSAAALRPRSMALGQQQYSLGARNAQDSLGWRSNNLPISSCSNLHVQGSRYL